MIDTHSHLLPGVDDGVQNEEDALAILKAYSKDGVKGVCLTPHYALLRGFHEEKAYYETRFEALKKQVKAAGIEIDLYLGSEIDEYDNLEAIIEKSHTMNNTHYVLIDFGMRKAEIEEVVYTLKMKGYQTVVAHPERYRYMNIEAWKKVRNEGGLLQVSAAHLIKEGSKRSQKMAMELFKEDMIDLVASDIHHPDYAKSMVKAYKFVKKKKDKATADRLFDTTPKKVLGIE
ncbi:MAG: tyrosine-protein phosphatase [Bacillota bacterium]